LYTNQVDANLLCNLHVLVEVLRHITHILLDLIDHMGLIHHMQLPLRQRWTQAQGVRNTKE